MPGARSEQEAAVAIEVGMPKKVAASGPEQVIAEDDVMNESSNSQYIRMTPHRLERTCCRYVTPLHMYVLRTTSNIIHVIKCQVPK